jgi:hypothetical protein
MAAAAGGPGADKGEATQADAERKVAAEMTFGGGTTLRCESILKASAQAVLTAQSLA